MVTNLIVEKCFWDLLLKQWIILYYSSWITENFLLKKKKKGFPMQFLISCHLSPSESKQIEQKMHSHTLKMFFDISMEFSPALCKEY